MSNAIHDPIHGSIALSAVEWAIVDSRPFQRLRHIKQLGFADFAFPGATHTRYAHSLGAMQMVSRMFDQVWQTLPEALPEQERMRLRQATRLAMLLHDIGHPPLSHVSERLMPELEALGLPPGWSDKEGGRQASHEDYTLKLLWDSEIRGIVDHHLKAMSVDTTLLASLIVGRALSDPEDSQAESGSSDALGLVIHGRDLLPLLSALISGEVDADRMDYLRRDAYSCGVSYGHFDHAWLCNALTAIEGDGALSLGLVHRGVWAFENFLLARYHMFLAVYHHHIPVCFDYLLGQFFKEGGYTLPTQTESYLKTDDVHLLAALRASDSCWAEAIVRRRPFKLLVETHAYDTEALIDRLETRLVDAKVHYFRADSQGMLSKYFGVQTGMQSLGVLEREIQRVRRVDEYTPLYRRFEKNVNVSRIFCRPDHLKEAKVLLDGCR